MTYVAVTTQTKIIDPLFLGQDGTAPLWIAAQMGHDEVVKVLLLRGADRDADGKVCVEVIDHITSISSLLKLH